MFEFYRFNLDRRPGKFVSHWNDWVCVTIWKPVACLALLFSLFLMGCQPSGVDSNPDPKLNTAALSLQALDLEGEIISPMAVLSDPSCKGLVVIFIATDCPISNRYAPEVRRIYEAFHPQGIEFFLVYTRPDESTATIRQHLEDYEYPISGIIDHERQITQFTGAQVTPESVVFDATGTMVYRGRIDDRFQDFGLSRTEPTARDLLAVLEDVAKGKDREFSESIAVGCYIVELYEEESNENL